MRVLQFGKYYPPDTGGIETVVQQLTVELNARGVRCDVLCASSSRRTTVDETNGYRIVRVGSLGKAFSTAICPLLLWWLFRFRLEYDVIHVHMPDPLALIALLLVRPAGKIVVHWHADIDYERFAALGPLFRPFDRWLAERCDHVIGATRAHLECSSNRDLFARKASVIPYPLPLDGPPRVSVDPVDADRAKDKFVVLGVGRLVYYKGFEFLIDAATHLPSDCVVLIGGSGPLEASLRERIRSRGLEGRVFLLGRIPDERLASYYSLCDVLCFPSTHRGEMFGMVQIEAMRFGKPVVGTRIPLSGVAEVNIDGVTGFVVAPMNASALAERILFLKAHPDIYESMARSAARRAYEVYRPDAVMPQLIELYARMCAAPQ